MIITIMVDRKQVWLPATLVARLKQMAAIKVKYVKDIVAEEMERAVSKFEASERRRR